MPRFSIIVPAHQAQAYLPECLESVLTQCFTDLELIAVVDCSPAACAGILTETAAADPRMSVLRLPEQSGPGPARNAGLAHARGDYVMFLDSDDALAPGALQAVADRLEDTADPDVLVFEHLRAFWHGGSDRGTRAGLLADREPQVFRLRDRPALLRLPPVAWNKAYRREFLLREGLGFPPGAFDGTPFSWAALLTAEAVTVLDRPCVLHRQRRKGAAQTAADRRPFDVFGQYDRVFRFLEERPELSRWGPLLYRRMTDHLLSLFLTPGRLPQSCRAEFFRRSSKQCLRHQAVAGRTDLRHLLVRLGARRTFQALWACRGLRRGAGRLAGSLRGAVLRLHHRVQSRRPLDPDLAVFTSSAPDGGGGDPAALAAAAQRLVPGLRTVWVCGPDQEPPAVLPPQVRVVPHGSAAHWGALARARYRVLDGAPEFGRAKRSGQVMVQTHRGTPLGHLGLDLRDHPVAADGMDFERLLAQVDEWDYSLSANRHSTLVWERAYPGSYTTLECGAPRNDVFSTATAEDVARARAALDVPPDSTAVLYAPAPREYLNGRPGSRLDLRRLAGALGRGFTVLDADGGRPPAELCLAADLLVTDYAPLMFDFANLDRPIVVHADDWDAYRATRGTYLDLPACPPGPVTRDTASLVSLLREGEWRTPRSEALRAAFRARFCPYDDGQSAERVIRAVFLDSAGLAPAVPVERRTPAPAHRPAPGARLARQGSRQVVHPAQPSEGSGEPARL
ncbi:bifunctional glycosyltransferase family 2 protein/CDP-glycerol:glycerophosphate glycerophosphotransferase [Streptomyces sp. 549]|uniref:bifunctional glycosyltransferase/CDP-glycerol:glycerophosphate glycerophosphotransferase n=1 Tax=Streptomyces sp. 549 TaxID=3049076 RepID=UPI0024C27C88|nr:bifunctional glycosyltransferase family 2 protein/CDP-glycerol:glycerophosphate glycerophosphotransferase [Streptomyces sp. 549]MDK1473874.1 bifunctional glycosyltransferase family 2 protein/CDP-glycerol:glycerophosphate glycerophosphotransferase [Streptomyces sp. 549]